ncbi:hypothetical protein BDV12DRAFT_160048 [Aspergillus spectabilis]
MPENGDFNLSIASSRTTSRRWYCIVYFHTIHHFRRSGGQLLVTYNSGRLDENEIKSSIFEYSSVISAARIIIRAQPFVHGECNDLTCRCPLTTARFSRLQGHRYGYHPVAAGAGCDSWFCRWILLSLRISHKRNPACAISDPSHVLSPNGSKKSSYTT